MAGTPLVDPLSPTFLSTNQARPKQANHDCARPFKSPVQLYYLLIPAGRLQYTFFFPAQQHFHPFVPFLPFTSNFPPPLPPRFVALVIFSWSNCSWFFRGGLIVGYEGPEVTCSVTASTARRKPSVAPRLSPATTTYPPCQPTYSVPTHPPWVSDLLTLPCCTRAPSRP